MKRLFALIILIGCLGFFNKLQAANTLIQDSLEIDKQALLDFIAAVDGPENEFPYRPANWSASNSLTNDWEGVTITNNRVTALTLPGVTDLDLLDGDQSRILDGSIPDSFKNLTVLENLDLNGNYIRFLPDLSNLQHLISIDVINNRLDFNSLLPNVVLNNSFLYVPQRRLGQTVFDTVRVGDHYVLSVPSQPEGTVYQWKFGQFIPGHDYNNDVVDLLGADSSVLVIDSIKYKMMGTYRLTMTHPELPYFTLATWNTNLVASTMVSGMVTIDNLGTPITGGQVIAYRSTPVGPFVAEDTAIIKTNGAYEFEKLVLGDFLFLAVPDREDYPLGQDDKNVVKTYHQQAELFDGADILQMRNDTAVYIRMIIDELPIVDGLGARIEGFLSNGLNGNYIIDNCEQYRMSNNNELVRIDCEPADSESENRFGARKKESGAAITLRRLVASGRANEESEYVRYAYTETDAEGEFSFDNVKEGTYKLHIDYPGVPMDPDAEIDFVVDKEGQLFAIEAIITEEGILVESKEILTIEKSFLDQLEIYPNPTSDLLQVSFSLDQKLDHMKYELLDLNGKVLELKQLTNQPGNQMLELNVAPYHQGIYLLVFTANGGDFRQQVRVIKQLEK